MIFKELLFPLNILLIIAFNLFKNIMVEKI